MAPLAAGGMCKAAGAGAKDTLRKEEKKQLKRKELRSFLHVSSGATSPIHIPGECPPGHALLIYICKK